MKNLKSLALLHALCTAIYVSLVALFMQNGERIFGKMDNLFGPVAILLIFVLSAAVTGSLVLGRPILMYLDNRKAEALKMFFYTLGWLFVILAVIIGVQVII
jgi:hypothetical protein